MNTVGIPGRASSPGRATDGSIQTLTVPIRGNAVSAQGRDGRPRPAPAADSRGLCRFGRQGPGRRETAVTADYFHAVTAPTPYVLAFVLGISFLLLLVAFRSLTVALVSIALNLLAVGAAYGLLTLVFIHEVGAGIFGFTRVAAIDAWVPLFLFSVLFALLLDATVVRTVILPSTLTLLDHRSWYLRRWLDWLPRLQADPAP